MKSSKNGLEIGGKKMERMEIRVLGWKDQPFHPDGERLADLALVEESAARLEQFSRLHLSNSSVRFYFLEIMDVKS